MHLVCRAEAKAVFDTFAVPGFVNKISHAVVVHQQEQDRAAAALERQREQKNQAQELKLQQAVADEKRGQQKQRFSKAKSILLQNDVVAFLSEQLNSTDIQALVDNLGPALRSSLFTCLVGQDARGSNLAQLIGNDDILAVEFANQYRMKHGVTLANQFSRTDIKQLKKRLNEAAADSLCALSRPEYDILLENFRPVVGAFGDRWSGKNFFHCYQYNQKLHLERNRLFLSMVHPRHGEDLVGRQLSHPSVSVDVVAYMDSITKLPNYGKCVAAREVEKSANRTLLLEDSVKYAESFPDLMQDLTVLHQVLRVREWSTATATKTHLLVLQMDQAAMYTRAKEIREFAHNFVCFVWRNLGLARDWLSEVPAMIHEGEDELVDVCDHLDGPLREQMITLLSGKPLCLPNGDEVRCTTRVFDGKGMRGGIVCILFFLIISKHTLTSFLFDRNLPHSWKRLVLQITCKLAACRFLSEIFLY